MSQTDTPSPRVAAAPEGTPHGAHDRGDGSVTFALWAPWKQSVHLIGEFNGWDFAADPLAVDESGLWWVEKQLPPGEHAYQFVIDGDTVVADPYARRLRWVSESAQPHCIVAVGAKPYAWGDEGFGIKPLNQLVIYELHVGDFSPQGTFEGIVERLDYLAHLGVDAIELMPIQEFPGDRSWGYNPAFLFAVEGAYGTVDDLKRLVNAAHQKGIGVILDMVFAHTTSDGPLGLLYPFEDNPYLAAGHNPWGFPSLDQHDNAAKRLMKDVQDYWLIEFHIDGFRYDYVEGIRYDGESGMSFLTWAARQTKPHAYLICEDIVPDPAAVVRDTEADCSWHWQFNKVVRAQLTEREYQGNHYGDMDAVWRVTRFDGDSYADNAQPVNFMESHDEERIVHDVLLNEAIGEAGATRKSMLGAVLLFTAQGVPMLYAGQEFGARAPKTIDVSKLPWEYLEGDAGGALYRHYATLAYLRHTVGALQGNNIELLLMDKERCVVAFHRWNDAGSVVVVAVNFSAADQRVAIDFPRPGRWHEWLHDYDEHVGEGPVEVDIPDSYAKIWVFQE